MTIANRLPTGSAPLPPATNQGVPRTGVLAAAFLIVAAASMALAVRSPLAVTVLGLIAFGVLHNVLEIRYVAGRFATILTGRFLSLLLILISAIVLSRGLAGFGPELFRGAEIGIAYLVLAVGCWYGLAPGNRRSPMAYLPMLVSGVVLAGAAVLSFAFPDYHFVVLTHLHNLVPLIFLWEWASRLPTAAGRRTFRWTQVAWIVIIPVMILLGAFDPLISQDPGIVQRFVGDGSLIMAETTPPGAEAAMSSVIGIRFLVVFAFMATMHYLVWIAFLPMFAPEATDAFEARVPWLTTRRTWLLGIAGGAFLAVLFISDYFQGKALYSALATYHAYLEFPVLLALLMGIGQLRRSAAQVDRG